MPSFAQIQAELDQVRNLANQALHRPTAGGDVVSGVLANRVEADTGTGTVVGQTVRFDSPSITRTSGAPGNFDVKAVMNVLATDGDELTFQLVRDPTGANAAFGPLVHVTADANGVASCTLVYNDAGGAGAHVYAVRCTDTTSTDTVAVNGSGSTSIEVQETL